MVVLGVLWYNKRRVESFIISHSSLAYYLKPINYNLFLMPNNIYNNLSDDDLNVSYWYVTHRILLRKVGIGVLMIFSLAVLVFGIVNLVNFYSAGEQDIAGLTSSVTQEKLNIELLAEANKPKDLSVGETKVLAGNKGYVDFVTEMFNPNIQWTVQSFDYYYMIGEEKTETRTDFILPGQEKYLIFFNHASKTSAINAQLVIENIRWDKISNYQSLKEKMLVFDFNEAKVLSADNSGLSEDEKISTVSFDILNKTSYNFWEPRFIVLLTRGDKLIAVADVFADGLAPGERKSESINLIQSLPSSTKLQIVPDINILDPAVFKSFATGSGELK